MSTYKKISKKKLKKKLKYIVLIIAALYIFIDLAELPKTNLPIIKDRGEITEVSITANDHDEFLDQIPEYKSTPSYILNNNKPQFTDEEYQKAQNSYIELSELDGLGRCGPCETSLNIDSLPTEERGDISSVRPSGWHQAMYPDLIEKNGGALYNRCHLLMYALTGLNADPRNLITGTEYLNVSGMLPYEKAVQNWAIKSKKQVLYRVTPIFKDNELVARGVLIEAADVETQGKEFHINAYCYNVEPGITIDYSTGYSEAN